MDLSTMLMQHIMLGQLKNYYNKNRYKQIDEAAKEPTATTVSDQPTEQYAKPQTVKQFSDGSWKKWDDEQQSWVEIPQPRGK